MANPKFNPPLDSGGFFVAEDAKDTTASLTHAIMSGLAMALFVVGGCWFLAGVS